MLINKKLLSVSILSLALLGGSENTAIASATYQADSLQVLVDLSLEMGRLAERQEQLVVELGKPLTPQRKREVEFEMQAISEALDNANQLSEQLHGGKAHKDVCPTRQSFESSKRKFENELDKVIASGEKIENILDKSSQLASVASKFKESSKKEGLLGTKVGSFLTGLGKKCGIIK